MLAAQISGKFGQTFYSNLFESKPSKYRNLADAQVRATEDQLSEHRNTKISSSIRFKIVQLFKLSNQLRI